MSSAEVILQTQIEPDIDGFGHHNERFVPCGKAHVHYASNKGSRESFKRGRVLSMPLSSVELQ